MNNNEEKCPPMRGRSGSIFKNMLDVLSPRKKVSEVVTSTTPRATIGKMIPELEQMVIDTQEDYAQILEQFRMSQELALARILNRKKQTEEIIETLKELNGSDNVEECNRAITVGKFYQTRFIDEKKLKGVFESHGTIQKVIGGEARNRINMERLKVRQTISINGDLEGNIQVVAVHPSSNYIVVGMTGGSKCMYVFSSISGRLVRSFGHKEEVHSISFSLDGDKIYGGVNSGVAIWNFNTGALENILDGHKRKTIALISPDGKYLVSGDQNGEDSTLKIWDVAFFKCIHTAYKLSSVQSIVISSDSRYIHVECYSMHEPTFILGFKNTGDALPPKKVGRRVNGLVLAGKSLGFGESASEDDDFISKVYLVPDGQLDGETTAVMFSVKCKGIFHLVSSSEGGHIAVSSPNDNIIRIWTNNGKLENELSDHKSSISGIAFSPDGTFLITASSESENTESLFKIWQ